MIPQNTKSYVWTEQNTQGDVCKTIALCSLETSFLKIYINKPNKSHVSKQPILENMKYFSDSSVWYLTTPFGFYVYAMTWSLDKIEWLINALFFLFPHFPDFPDFPDFPIFTIALIDLRGGSAKLASRH